MLKRKSIKTLRCLAIILAASYFAPIASNAQEPQSSPSATREQQKNEPNYSSSALDSARINESPYKPLRYEEDWTFLREPKNRHDFFDQIKYIPLRRNRENWYLSIGGEVKPNYERYRNEFFGQFPRDDDGYLLQRYMLHFDAHLSRNFRAFFQLKSGLENGRVGGARPPDKDTLDVHQAFFDWRLTLGRGKKPSGGNAKSTTPAALTFRIGRQELVYGSGKLIDAREGPNVRQSFDAVRAIFETDNLRIDFFAAKPVQTNAASFDDKTQGNQTLWGIYATRQLKTVLPSLVDVYYIGFDRRQALFDAGAGRETRHSFGARFASQPSNKAGFDYDAETTGQLGTFRAVNNLNRQIRAWSAGAGAGYTFQKTALTPRVGFGAAIISGDRNPNDNSLNTFNSLFPRGAYFGNIAQNGPSNVRALQPNLTLKFPLRVSTVISNYLFWRDSTRDGLYSVPGGLLRQSGNSRARFIGTQPDFLIGWQASRHLSAYGFYSYFFTGGFLRESPPNRDASYVSAVLVYKF